MEFPQDQIDELLALSPGAKQMEEGGTPFFLLSSYKLPAGTNPETMDLLLCPIPRDGYDSRLFFATKPTVNGRDPGLNWNANGVHILSRNWFAHSWRTKPGLTLAQMVAMHLRALR